MTNEEKQLLGKAQRINSWDSTVFTCAIISTSPATIPDIQIPITGTYPYTDPNGKPATLSGTIDLGQIKTIGKERIISAKICKLSTEMSELDTKLLNILGLSYMVKKKDNIISSLSGKIDYLKKQLKDKA